ncbi:MAG: hypothetical protein QGH49_08555 [SAR324 cluster bacterium]|nr:hypothetical protein [SAR324 cluster bacterium]
MTRIHPLSSEVVDSASHTERNLSLESTQYNGFPDVRKQSFLNGVH